MKSILGASIMALLLVCLALPSLVLAGSEGSTAAGSFKFALEDGEVRFVEFKAEEQADGQAVGDLTFSDPAAVPVDDPDNTEKPQSPGVLVRAKLDCMTTSKNTAIVGGEIYESNVPSAVGLRFLLVVEDNGVEGGKDRLAWGIYQNPATGWKPTDAERDNDEGATLTWLATDAELKEDVGVRSDLSKVVRCTSFPVGSYDFPEFKYGGGDLQVTSR